MRLMVSAVVAVALIAVVTSMLRSRLPSIDLSTAALPSLEEFHAIVGVDQLPVQEIEDQSLIYPTRIILPRRRS
jgi:hypothetical protein